MPGPIIRQQSLPWWADPKGASVFDVPGQGMLRQLVGWLGLDDPTQIMGLGVPIETGAATGGVLDLLAQKFPRLANAIKAYHGSPHDFERFDMNKIGTGEGAQAYGHGLYFAEKEGTAESYRDALGGIVRNPYKAQDDLELSLVQQYLGKYRNKADAIREMRNIVAAVPAKTPAERTYAAALIRAANGLEAEYVQPGRMYEVAIHADPEHFLDWDKPLSQQGEKVKAAIAKLPEKMRTLRDPITGKYAPQYGEPLGSEIYRKIGSEPHASGVLKAEGIPGIKYLDQGSRAEGKGTYNYVVFDDRLVEILKKYGIAVTTAAGLADLERQRQAAKP